MPIMPLARNWKEGGIPFGLAPKGQQTETGKKAVYVLASEMDGKAVTTRDHDDH